MGEFTVHYNAQLLAQSFGHNWLRELGVDANAAHTVKPDGLTQREWDRILNGMDDAMTERIFMAIKSRLSHKDLVEIFPFLRR